MHADRVPHFQVDFHASNSWCVGSNGGLVLADFPVAATRTLSFSLQPGPRRACGGIAHGVAARFWRQRSTMEGAGSRSGGIAIANADSDVGPHRMST